MPSVFGRREEPARARQRSISPSSPNIAAASTTYGDNTTPFLRVCWDWRNSTCYKERCTFAHHYITCPEWRKGQCTKSEKDCKFDHCEGRDPVIPDYRAGPPILPPSNIPLGQLPSVQQTPGMSPPHVVPSSEEIPPNLERRSMTGAHESRPNTVSYTHLTLPTKRIV